MIPTPNILLHALGKYDVVCIDTNCKFKDSPIKLVHCVKDYKHPYNQVVESKIGQLKKRIYANIDVIQKMDIDHAISFIKDLALIQFENKIKIELKVLA